MIMISTWKRRRAARRAAKELLGGEGSEMELTTPNHFRCPISLDLMKDPVTLSTGITYDRENIEKWIETGNVTCPITNQVLTSLEAIPNHTIRKMIQDWCVENRSHGIERIPTPRIPVSSMEVSEILSKITMASKKEDQVKCRDLVMKIKTLVKESERNKRCIAGNGTGSVLSAAFEGFSKTCFEENVPILEEILSALTLVFPLDGEAVSHLGSSSSLHCIVWFLKSGDLSRRRNAVFVLKQIVSSEQRKVNVLLEIEGVMEALFKLIQEPICPTSTKASLIVIHHMVTFSTTNEKIVSKLVDSGLVSVLLEILLDAQRSLCEKALCVLDGILSFENGREEAYNHALTVPVIVKKILRISDMATEASVSILWKLCMNEKREEKFALAETLQVGAFQKLLLLLQLGCGEKTKEKVTELLKLLNLYRDRLECIDSMDFKDLKRPF
ncbi:U-box domain-containing protein 21-like [Pistacia vera]|uniref:U-box domain-containing protein 21-like n=1 Tax=Pistacia vera TaxID=55513 RepID=UPI001263E613|nr:U-box domain-containing protein 21-like [Pistacia vera]